jgi:hypothetical protein
MPCDLNLNFCPDANFSGFFVFSPMHKQYKQYKKDVKNILDNIEKMDDYMVNKRVMINVVLQGLKKILNCEHYILHTLDLKGHKLNSMVNAHNNRIYNLDDYRRFLVYKNKEIEPVDIDKELEAMETYVQQHLKDDNSVNYVSKNFMEKCSDKFVSKYFSFEDPTMCTANINSPDNIFGHCITNNKYFITNDIFNEEVSACRFADGHPPIKKFMAIPFSNPNGVVYAICGFANSTRNLTEKDFKLIKPVINALNSILPDLLNK